MQDGGLVAVSWVDTGGRAWNARIGLNLTFVLFLVCLLLVSRCVQLVVLAGTCVRL